MSKANKILYKYTFEKKCFKINQDDLLSAFEQNFIRSGCYHKITRKENELKLENNILDFNYLYKMVTSWNLWYGIGNMNVNITHNLSNESYLVKFSISILRLLIFHILYIIIFCIALITYYTTELFYFFILFNIIAIASYFVNYKRHQRFFNKTIKIGDFYKNQVEESYDWELILKKKTNSEITQIIKGNTLLPNIVIELAKKELKNRNNRNY